MIELYGRCVANTAPNRAIGTWSTHVYGQKSVSEIDIQNAADVFTGWEGESSQRGFVADGDGITTTIIGEPRWRDPQLERIASKRGHPEALRAAYIEEADEALKQLHGRFALSISDDRNGRLVLAVDRMGIERMCYCHDPGESLTFGSSLNSIKTLRRQRSTVSNQALFTFLYFHVIPSPESIYENIHKLEPGQFLVFDGTKINVSRYWRPKYAGHTGASESELASELFEKLESAIIRCDDTENAGCFLSGGLDSSTVTGIACQSSSSKVDAFTIGFDQSGYDEVEYARAAAKHFNANIIEYYVTPSDIASTVDEIAVSYDEPFGNSSAIPTFFCAKLAADRGKTHLIAGDGGDELFAGNERYETQIIFDYYNRVPSWIKSTLLEPAFLSKRLDFIPLHRKARRYIEQAKIPMPERLQTYNTLYVNRISDVFTDSFLETIDISRPITSMREWYEKNTESDFLHRMLFFDWKLTLSDNDIRKVNVMCNRAGIQVSYPMLDDDLVEFSTRIPTHSKIRHRQLRRFFRRAVADFLPEQVLSKSKHGFGLPFGEWLKSSVDLQRAIYPSLDALSERNIVEKSFIDSMRHKHMVEHASYYGGILWTLVMLERWLQKNT